MKTQLTVKKPKSKHVIIFDHARVDFYVIDDEPVFGEITFTNGAGFDRFQPYEFDLAMGEALSLPVAALGANEDEEKRSHE